ncbi:MAG: hypothetical protein HC828_07960 [Blastochloris sp.]|nr:hypothetical protein [Blastochloris sp.]
MDAPMAWKGLSEDEQREVYNAMNPNDLLSPSESIPDLMHVEIVPAEPSDIILQDSPSGAVTNAPFDVWFVKPTYGPYQRSKTFVDAVEGNGGLEKKLTLQVNTSVTAKVEANVGVDYKVIIPNSVDYLWYE